MFNKVEHYRTYNHIQNENDEDLEKHFYDAYLDASFDMKFNRNTHELSINFFDYKIIIRDNSWVIYG